MKCLLFVIFKITILLSSMGYCDLYSSHFVSARQIILKIRRLEKPRVRPPRFFHEAMTKSDNRRRDADLYEGKSCMATDVYLENNSVRSGAAAEICWVGHRRTFTRRARWTSLALDWSIGFMNASLHAFITDPRRHCMWWRRGRIVTFWTTKRHHGAHKLARTTVITL